MWRLIENCLGCSRYRRLVLALVLGSWLAAAAWGKSSRTYYTEAELAAIRQRAQDPRYESDVKAIVKAAAILADRSDEEIWDMVPPADLTRALTVRYEFDCPVHGKEVYRVGGRYPWITSPDKPFKVECPVGHEVYPTNDFAEHLKEGRQASLDTRQKYLDDGNGYIDEDGNRYFFVGYYNFWHRWRKSLIDGTSACGNAYLVTGDPKYAHKAAVALASISRVYPKMDYSTQAYHNGKWPAGINGRILDYIWENQTVGAFSIAYDQIYPTLDDDRPLNALAAARGVPDIKTAIERDILQQMAGDLLEKRIWGNKFELRSTAALALILDNRDPAKGLTSRQMVDWVLKGGGDLEFTFYNGFDRDGIGGESSLSYSNIWNVASVAAAEDLARMGVKMVTDPKWLRLAKGSMEMRLLEDLSPRLGDVDGHIKANRRIVNDELLMFGVSHFKDADCAALLLRKGQFKPPILSRHLLDEASLKALAAGASFPDPPYTRNAGGYGLAILELNDGRQTSSATMYYGSPMASHGHLDRLTMSYHLGDRDVLPELGYPSQWGPTADLWVKNTISHYCVLVDERPHTARHAGHLTSFVDLDGMKLAEAQAARVWSRPPPPPPVPVGSIGGEVKRPAPSTQGAQPIPAVSDYRRLIALLDSGEKSTLLVETFFTEGGRQHDYSFHGLPYGDFSVQDTSIIRQPGGTLAGETVAWGADPGRGRASSGFQFLSDPRWYEPTDAPHFCWRNDSGINMDTWFPRLAYDELIVADGKPPTYPGWPASMPFILLRHKSEEPNLRSLFLSITEAGKKEPTVQSVRPIRSNSPLAGGAVVEMRSGSTWRIYRNAGPQPARFDDQAESSVALAAIRYTGGKPVKAYLIGAGTFANPQNLRLTQPPATTMQIKSVDYRSNTVAVTGDAPKGIGGNGLVLLATRGKEMSASYTARQISPAADGGIISFGEIPLLVGRFEAAWDPARRLIVSRERTGGVYNQLVAYPMVGTSVVSEDLATTAVITAYDREADTFTIDADGATASAFKDHDGDGRSYVYLAHLAPGVNLRATPASVIDLAVGKPSR